MLEASYFVHKNSSTRWPASSLRCKTVLLCFLQERLLVCQQRYISYQCHIGSQIRWKDEFPILDTFDYTICSILSTTTVAIYYTQLSNGYITRNEATSIGTTTTKANPEVIEQTSLETFPRRKFIAIRYWEETLGTITGVLLWNYYAWQLCQEVKNFL